MRATSPPAYRENRRPPAAIGREKWPEILQPARRQNLAHGYMGGPESTVKAPPRRIRQSRKIRHNRQCRQGRRNRAPRIRRDRAARRIKRRRHGRYNRTAGQAPGIGAAGHRGRRSIPRAAGQGKPTGRRASGPPVDTTGRRAGQAHGAAGQGKPTGRRASGPPGRASAAQRISASLIGMIGFSVMLPSIACNEESDCPRCFDRAIPGRQDR